MQKFAPIAFLLSSLFTAALSAHPQRENTDTNAQYFSSWTAAVAGIQSDDFNALPKDMQNTALFVSSLLEIGVKRTKSHFLNPQELAKARENLREEALVSLQKKLDTARIALDTASLADEKKETASARFKAQKDIRKIQKDMRTVRNLKNEDIPISSALPVLLAEQSEYLSIKPAQDLQELAGTLGAQSLLYFRLNSLEDRYVIISLYEYNGIMQKESRVMETIADYTRIASLQESIAHSISKHITGKPAASLRIQVTINAEEPSRTQRTQDAVILIDGLMAGAGSVSLDVIPAGTHSVIVKFQGQQRTLKVSLQPNEHAVREIFFDINPKNVITVLSIPAKANVYINSLWAGTTPVVLSRPYGSAADQIEIRLPGYETARRTITSISPPTLTAQLHPSYEVPLGTRLKQHRNGFYTAFSIFAASLIAPIVLNGLYQNENATVAAAQHDPKVTTAARTHARSLRDAYWYSYVSASIVSGGLAIYAAAELFRYLKTAGEYHEK